MSSYGPPGPGQPEDPTNEPRWTPPDGGYPPPPAAAGYPPPPGSYPPPDPYAPPPGQYGAQPDPYAPPPPDQYGAQPGQYPPPPPGQYGAQPGQYPSPPGQYGAPGQFGPGIPAAPAKRKGLKIGLIIGAVVLLLLCVCGGLGIWGLVSLESDGSDPGPIGAPTPSATAPASPTASPTPTAGPTEAVPNFLVGDCLVNDGSNSEPELRKVPCAPDTYEVLLRIPFSTDGDACEQRSPESDSNYVYDNTLDIADYVLCMKRR